ncbi:MAG TPA: radical SAM protein [Thermoplasmata archaeon]|nr:radical SAM protein [Thermoplasmata archaeon]
MPADAFGSLVSLPLASSHRGPLSLACTQCAQGQKMVLFVSGVCRFRCFYCPVGETRNQIDVTYANERRVSCDADVLAEAHAIGAAGTGITGGDPLGFTDRVEHYIRLLKSEFGPGHDIHLYTHEPNPEKLQKLIAAGLDEFRLHIPWYLWGPLRGEGQAYRRVLEDAAGWGVRRGVEIPVLPDHLPELRSLLRALDGIGLDFVNLNELEFSETNEQKLHARGYVVDTRSGWGVRGSRAGAAALVRDLKLRTPVHFCSSRFKDGIQLRQRLLRRAARVAPAFAEHTGDGTVRLGIVEAPSRAALDRISRELARRARLGPTDYRVDRVRRRVELAPSRLRRVARGLEAPAFVVEEYPTADALEVEREPLNAAGIPAQARLGGT